MVGTEPGVRRSAGAVTGPGVTRWTGGAGVPRAGELLSVTRDPAPGQSSTDQTVASSAGVIQTTQRCEYSVSTQSLLKEEQNPNQS